MLKKTNALNFKIKMSFQIYTCFIFIFFGSPKASIKMIAQKHVFTSKFFKISYKMNRIEMVTINN